MSVCVKVQKGHISRDKIGRSQQHFITGVRGADTVKALWYDFDEVHTEQLMGINY